MRDWGRAARGSLSAKNQEEKPKYKCRINVSESVHLREKRGKKPTPETKRNIKERGADENIFSAILYHQHVHAMPARKTKGYIFTKIRKNLPEFLLKKQRKNTELLRRKACLMGMVVIK